MSKCPKCEAAMRLANGSEHWLETCVDAALDYERSAERFPYQLIWTFMAMKHSADCPNHEELLSNGYTYVPGGPDNEQA